MIQSPSGFQPKPAEDAHQPSPEIDDVIVVKGAYQPESSALHADDCSVGVSRMEEHLSVRNSLATEVAVQESPAPDDSSGLASPEICSIQSPCDHEVDAGAPSRRSVPHSVTSHVQSEARNPWNISLSGDVATGATDIKLHGIPPDCEAAVMILVNALCGIMDKSGANDAKPEPSSIIQTPKAPRAPMANMSRPTAIIETPAPKSAAINRRINSSSKARRTTLIDTPAVSTKPHGLATAHGASAATRTPNTTYGNYTHAEVKAEIERAAAAVGESAPNKNRRDEIKAMYLLGQFELFGRKGDVHERVPKCAECVKRGKSSCFVVDEDRETVIVTQRCAWCLHDRRKCED